MLVTGNTLAENLDIRDAALFTIQLQRPLRGDRPPVVFLAVSACNSHISVEDALGVRRELSARVCHG
jgi:hypothetical protein